MPLSRRRFIAMIGGGTVFAATGAATAFALTRTPRSALAPSDAAGGMPNLGCGRCPGRSSRPTRTTGSPGPRNWWG